MIEGTSIRGNCPSCGGINTYIESKQDGYVRFHCFRSTCNRSSRKYQGLSLEEVQDKLSNKEPITSNKWTGIPEHWVPVDNRPECMDFIRRYGCVSFYTDHPSRFRFDPSSNRLCFLSTWNAGVVGATGRMVCRYSDKTSITGPKWFIYDSGLYPFTSIVGNSDVFCIVEDCPSACAAYSVGVTGIALRGTNLAQGQIKHIAHTVGSGRLLIALDADATKKAFDMARRLSLYVRNVTVVPLERDLKLLSKEQICKVLKL